MRRIYFLLPDEVSCEAIVDELESIDIPLQHLHVIRNFEDGESHLPRANVWQRSNLGGSIIVGGLLGSLAGFIAGVMIIVTPLSGEKPGWEIVSLVSVIGALMGAFINSMVSGGDFNHQLDTFRNAITHGQVLLMVDVPAGQQKSIADRVLEQHPEAHLGTVAHKHL